MVFKILNGQNKVRLIGRKCGNLKTKLSFDPWCIGAKDIFVCANVFSIILHIIAQLVINENDQTMMKFLQIKKTGAQQLDR